MRALLLVVAALALAVAAMLGVGIATSSRATPGSAVRVAVRSTGNPVGSVNTITLAFMDKCGGVERVWETWLTLP
jgi:hypothetical protein